MKDRLGREIEYLRVSVTQNCNLRCIYCMPSGGEQKSGDCGEKRCSALTPGELEAIVRIMVELGVKKVRLTGGEPLTRPDICEIIGRISRIPGIEDLSLTTNGIHLGDMAEDLRVAGLKRINISLDSLKEERYERITGGGRLVNAMEGIRKALDCGLTPVKLNTVLIKGVNDDEVEDFIQIARDNPVEVRFIELMPMGSFGEQNTDIVYNCDIINSYPGLIPCLDGGTGQPARYYTIEGYKGRIGFISPMSHKFCGCCNRIRLTCDGKLRPCLGDNGETDLAGVLRNDTGKLSELIQYVIYNKPEGHNFGKGFISSRNMSAIGG